MADLLEIFVNIFSIFYQIITDLLEFFTTPFRWLKNRIVGLINDASDKEEKKEIMAEQLSEDKRPPVKRTARRIQSTIFDISFYLPYILLVGAIIYIIVNLFLSSASPFSYLVFVTMQSTACGQFAIALPQYLFQGIPFDWISISAIVIPGFFVSSLAGSLKKKVYNSEKNCENLDDLSKPFQIGAIIVFTIFFSFFAAQISSLSENIGLMLQNLFTYLTTFAGQPFFAIVAKCLLWIVFAYLAILMALIAIKELGETIFFGIIFFIIYFIVVIVLGLVFDVFLGINTDTAINYISFALILFLECARHYLPELICDGI